MSNKKKVLILCGMVLLLAVTAVFNYILVSANNGSDNGSTVTGNFFSDFRSERQTSRSSEMLNLDAVIASAEPGSDTYTVALADKLKLIKNMEKEMFLENIIKAKGFDDVAVSISLTSDNVNVIVKQGELSTQDVAIIFSAVKNEGGVPAQNIKIIPYN